MAWRPGTLRTLWTAPNRILFCLDAKSRPPMYVMSYASSQVQDWRFTVRSYSTSTGKPDPSPSPLAPPPPSNKIIGESETSSTLTGGGGTGNAVEKTKKPGLREMLKKYGLPFFVWYSSLYFGAGAMIYVSIESGLVGGGDILGWVRETGFSPEIVNKIDPKYGNIGAAIVLNECLEILRFPFALATTPAIVKTWKKFSEKKKTDGSQ